MNKLFAGFQFPKTILVWFEAHPGTAGWTQALIAGVAIVAVYIAATIPVRAETARLEKERKLKAQGLALLLIPEILVLKGELETIIETGSIYGKPIAIPISLENKIDELYLLSEAGGRLLQSVGLVRGVAAQTRRFQIEGITQDGPYKGMRIESAVPIGAAIWGENTAALRMGIMNLREVVDLLQSIIG
jgi:hypothetical protein